MKTSEIQGYKKILDFAASLPDMPVETSLFVKHKCHYAKKHAAV
jgi:hypothetical protein